MMKEDALAKLDQLLADNQRQKAALLELRAVVASERPSEPDPEPEFSGDDFATENLIDASTAAYRVGVSKQTMRRWVNDFGIGFKRGGRLIVSIPRLRRHIGEDA